MKAIQLEIKTTPLPGRRRLRVRALGSYHSGGVSVCGWEPGTAEDSPLFALSQLSGGRWGVTGIRLCSGHRSGGANNVRATVSQESRGSLDTANQCKLEHGGEVWPHLQLLLRPLCLPVVPEAFKAPSSVKHSAPCPGAEEHTNLTGATGLGWSGKVPRAQIMSCCCGISVPRQLSHWHTVWQ